MLRVLNRVITILFILIGCTWLFVNSVYFQQYLAEKVSPLLSEQTGMQISMERLSFGLPLTIKGHNLTVGDNTEAFFNAGEMKVSLSLKEFINRKFSIDSVEITNANLISLPALPVTSADTDKKNFPIDHVAVNNLAISPKIVKTLGLPPELSLKGINLNGSIATDGGLHFLVSNDRQNIIAFDADFYLSPTLDLTKTSLQAHIQNVALLPWKSPLEGILNAKLDFSGHITNPNIAISFSSQSTKYQQIDLQDVVGTLDCILLENSSIQAKANINCLVQEYPLNISTSINWEPERTIHLSDIKLLFANIALFGDLTFPHSGNWTDGQISGSIDDLSLFERWIPGINQGGIEFIANLTSFPSPSANIDLKASNININNVSIGNLNLLFDVSNLLTSPQAIVKLDCQQVQTGDIYFENIAATSAIDPNLIDHPFSINCKGTWREPFALKTNGKWSQQGKEIQLALDASLPPAAATFTLSINERNTSCKGSINAPNSPPIEFNASLPISYSMAPLAFQIDREGPIEGKLISQGEIAPLLQLLFADSSLLSGHANATLTLSGTLNTPQINGECDIVNGTFEIIEIGALLHDVSAHFEATGPQIILKKLTANDRNGGTLTGTGELILDFDQKLPFNLDMVLNNVLILNQDYAKANVNGSLVLKGNSSDGTLKGSLQTEKAVISIPEQTSALMNHVEVTYINLPSNSPPPQSLYLRPSSWPLSMDIALSIPKNLTIRGRDLTSEWKGDISIQGTAKNPLFNGEITVIDGEYNFNGKPFDINQGTVTLAGDIEKKTSLYVIASKDLGKVKVDVILKGSAKSPTISFRSNPPLPQREILSWILFNRGTSEISSFQGSQLSESISNLDSSHQGPDVLTKIRTALGIDRFDISRNPDSNDNSVNLQVGKYISDNVLISINKSDVNRLGIEAALTDRIKLQAQVGDDSEGQLLIKWKRDY